MNDEDVLMVASFGVRCSLLLFLYLYFFVLVLMLDFTIHILVILSEAEGSLTPASEARIPPLRPPPLAFSL